MAKRMANTHTHIDNKIQLYAAVLAGGLSSRMGCDKRFLEIDGERLVARALRLACVAIGGCNERVFLCGNVPGYSGLPDEVAGLGPIGGLTSAMRQMMVAASGYDQWLLVMPVDMPLLTIELLERLVSEIHVDAAAEVVSCEDYELPFVLHCDLKARTELALVCRDPNSSRRSIRALLERLEVRRMRLDDPVKKEMFNANSPLDWAELSKGSLQ